MTKPILKSSTSSPSVKRKVSFNKRVQAVNIRHHRDFSKRQFERCWHTTPEYEAIKQEVNHTIDHFNRSQSDIVSDDSSSSTQDMDQSNFCLRGLENRTDAHKGMKAHLRRAAWSAVLDGQEDQYGLGMPNNSAMLREAYSIYSLPASRIAQRRAWEDAIEAGYAMDGAEPPMAVATKTSSKPSSCIPPQRAVRKNFIISQAA